MKWAILGLWVAAILYSHYRGRIRAKWPQVFLNHSVFLAPINALMILASRVPTTPYLATREIPALHLLQENWQVIRDEAQNLIALQQLKAAQRHNDIGFNSFFKYGWKRFYLKWYDAKHPSAETYCPRTVALLNTLPEVKAAMFAVLPHGGQLNPHRDPFAGSLRYHLGLATPNDARCYIEVDGERYNWRDGEGVIFDETYIHEAHNQSGRDRLILFCDVERPLRWRWAQAFNRWFSRVVMSAASSPNDSTDPTGAINQLTHIHWRFEQARKRLKAWNRPLYKSLKWGAIVLILGGIVLI